ncbi:MAG: MFS transporter [Proteobacteria bacterium]|nr:MFS transporter [Pseudomonadota bacterium]
MTAKFILENNPRIRYATGALMYFAQGIPAGLLSIAIPAWLASQDVSAAEIGTYLAVIVLPWVFKLVTGPLMDRFEFLSMGRRRPWVLAAQLGLSLSLLTLMLVDRPAEQIGLLMMVGVLINIFAATQDVAVDGMSIDLTPIREQGRLNAFMSFGKAVGWASTAAVSGVLLVTWGMKTTAIAAAIVSGMVLIVFVFVLERDGERRLPWTRGKAASAHQPGNSFRAVFGGINSVLWQRVSVIVMLIMFFDGLVSGYGQALMPIAAVKLFGYTTPQWSQLVAVMGLTGAFLALALGPLIDRFGAKHMLMFTMTLLGAHALLLAQTQHLWQDTTYVRVMLSLWIMMMPVVMVCVIALAMAICSRSVSATQFAIYMSVANMGYAAGSKIYGMVGDGSNYVETYMLISVFVVATLFVLFFHRDQGLDAEAATKRVAMRQHTLAFGGSEAGVFWSGAMQCPKCRTDMEQVDYEGVEIDRCKYCKGIWFDAGESEALRNKKAAAAIDTGDARIGKRANEINRYPCPRCGGGMVRVVDARQTHIWYEVCSSCSGSFFDAGEFSDITQTTIADFFRLAISPRKTRPGS